MEVTKVINATRDFKIGEIETHALRGVNLSIEDGEFTALVGPSGSGKTTLLQLIGLLDQPTSGQVFINGQDATRLNRNKRADLRKGTIGFIFQFFALIPTLTAYENVEMPLLLLPLSRAERRKRIAVALEAVGLSDRADHYPRQLSGGQEQRVGIARAIVANPTVVVADEPTGDLDARNAEEVLGLLRQLTDQFGKTIVMVTHDPRALRFVDAAYHLDKGVLLEGDAAHRADEAIRRAAGQPERRP